jgi:hypothetical protein
MKLSLRVNTNLQVVTFREFEWSTLTNNRVMITAPLNHVHPDASPYEVLQFEAALYDVDTLASLSARVAALEGR